MVALGSTDVTIDSQNPDVERFRSLADTAPALIWLSGPDKLCTYFNKTWLDFTGRSFEQEIGNGWMEGVHTDDRETFSAVYNKAFDSRQPFKMELRLRRFDGEFRWVVNSGVPRTNSSNSFSGYIGTCFDISDDKAKEEKLRDLSGRLITAQEEERARIARELHDDLSQRMALVLIGLDRLMQQLPDIRLRKQLRLIAQAADEISSELHNISHQLHSSKLESLGLAAAIASHCSEVSLLHGLQVRFEQRDVPRHLPKDVTLCLYRALQEALRNVVKHSNVKKARVELIGNSREIQLFVSDAGSGFSLASRSGGLGLTSMQERLRLVNGELTIESQPSVGTRISARVPLPEEGRTDEYFRPHYVGA